MSFNLKFNRNLTESDIKIIDVKSQLEHQSQIQKTKGSGWMFDEISSRKTGFYKTTDMHGSIFLKIQLRSNATLNIGITDKCCFIWSALGHLHHIANAKYGHQTRVLKYGHYFNELNSQFFFDFTWIYK